MINHKDNYKTDIDCLLSSQGYAKTSLMHKVYGGPILKHSKKFKFGYINEI